MSWVDVDVIAKPQNIVGGVVDKRLKIFRTELENQNALAKKFGTSGEKLLVKDVTNIYDMVTRILSGIGNRRIRRLRIFGHGSPHTIQMGPLKYTGQGMRALSPVTKFDQNDLDKIIQVVLTSELKYDLLNRGNLGRLRGHFDPRGWVELQSCRVMDVFGDGNKLIEGLSDLWNVSVQASDARQIVGGGFEGNVWQAKPGKKAEKIRTQPQSSGLPSVSRTYLAGNDPLKEALDSLKHTPTAGTQPSQGTGQTRVFTYKPTKVGSFAGQSQISLTKKLVPQQAVIPKLKVHHTQTNPIKPAIGGLRGPSPTVVPLSKMPPGTVYSDINTGRTFRINTSGKHIDTGMIKGIAPKHDYSLASRIHHPQNDPLKVAFDSLKPKSVAISPMSPGTRYSDLSTRKTYEVDNFGKHIQTGSLQGFATRYGVRTTAQTSHAWQNPLREAVRKLGG